jgi:hypothetical protein
MNCVRLVTDSIPTMMHWFPLGPVAYDWVKLFGKYSDAIAIDIMKREGRGLEGGTHTPSMGGGDTCLY